MVKPIYCNLLLIFSCLIYEAYAVNHRTVRHIRLPSRVISNNIRPYDESSSPTTINDAGDNTATLEPAAQPSSPRLLKQSYSSNNGLGYNRNRGLVQDNKSSNYFGPYDLSSSSNTANVAGEDSEEQSSPSRLLKKSFSSNDALEFDGNRRSIHDMISSFSNKKPLSDLDNRNNSNDQIDTTLDDPSIQNKKNRMNFEVLNNRPLSSLNSRNMQNGNTSENQGIGKRQNKISDIQDFPSIGKTINTPSVRRLGSTRQNSLPPSLNEDDSQGISDGNENSNIMNMMNTFNNRGHKIVSISLRQCCINNECRMLKEGEQCGIEDYLKDMKNTKQQNGNDNIIMTKLMRGKLMPFRLNSLNRFGDSFNKDYEETEKPKNSMFGTSRNGDNDFIMPKLKDGKLKPLRLSSLNRFGHSFNEDSDTQETDTPKNMRLGSMGYSTNIPSFGSSNYMPDMNSEIIKPNYPYSEPIGVSKDEANEIRNDVLQKSNFYRNKFDLEPFTLDDQLNNCAQNWANYMAKQQLFDHRPENVYGENLYGNLNLKDLGKTAVDSWYNEMSLFTIDNVENFDTFHMTQLLWKESTKLGVGVSQNPENGMYYVVANYDPRGNLLGNFKKNLPEITEEDIEEAKEADKRLKAKLEKPVVMSWSSGFIKSFRIRMA
ncbi:unnamed protein product [Aphis gossypii]|uniref:SCP domain-containing protein n=1 Tax=Aphis gossypii TaxID=80765 RepID=A0A9P0IQ07_APHGO|nr:unnamed protein product [Aphis gossypii]